MLPGFFVMQSPFPKLIGDIKMSLVGLRNAPVPPWAFQHTLYNNCDY